MSPNLTSILLLLPAFALAAPHSPPLARADAPNGSCAPGGTFDLSNWNLQLPTGTQGHVDTITPAQLKECTGYHDPKYFYTASDGAMVLKVPGSSSSSGCVTTSGSKHCRTELREISPSSWDPHTGTNRLKVKLAVPTPDDSEHGTVIGQIHVDDSISSKPVCELFYNKAGEISLGVEQVPEQSSLKVSENLWKVSVGTVFTYEIRFQDGVLGLSVNGDTFKTFSTGQVGAPKGYFKVGNYNQGDAPSEVHVYSIDVQH